MIEQAFVQTLLADPAASGFTGPRVYGGSQLPQGAGYPNALVWRVSTAPVTSLIAPSGLTHARVQLDCRALNYGDAKRLADRARSLFNGFRGPLQGFTVAGMHQVGGHDEVEPPANADDVTTFRTCLDFSVWFVET